MADAKSSDRIAVSGGSYLFDHLPIHESARNPQTARRKCGALCHGRLPRQSGTQDRRPGGTDAAGYRRGLWEPADMDREPLERIDSFPYRHRVSDLMSAPAATIDDLADLQAAARLMKERDISSLLTVDSEGRPAGILTERDLMHRLAQHGAAAVRLTVAEVQRSRCTPSAPINDLSRHRAHGAAGHSPSCRGR